MVGCVECLMDGEYANAEAIPLEECEKCHFLVCPICIPSHNKQTCYDYKILGELRERSSSQS